MGTACSLEEGAGLLTAYYERCWASILGSPLTLWPTVYITAIHFHGNTSWWQRCSQAGKLAQLWGCFCCFLAVESALSCSNPSHFVYLGRIWSFGKLTWLLSVWKGVLPFQNIFIRIQHAYCMQLSTVILSESMGSFSIPFLLLTTLLACAS